jgi:hypothetical protein
MMARAFGRLPSVLATLWRALREWSGDAAYETYAARSAARPRLTREQVWLEGLRRRYDSPNRCC